MLHEQLFQSESIALHYAHTANDDAPPLLCLHGVTRGWQSFLPLLPTLALRWQVYAYDHRGHGQSRRAEKYLAIDYVADAIHFLHEEIKRPTVIYGHSLGAMVAAAVAAEAPDLVRAIILEDPPFHTMGERIERYVMYPYFVALESLASNRMSLSQLVEQLGAIEINTTHGKTALRNIRDEAALIFTAKCLQQLAPAVMTPIVRGEWLQGYDLAQIAQRVHCPALVMQADASAGGMLINEEAHLLQSNIADLTLIKVPGIGHQIHTNAPDVALGITQGFLASL